MSVPETVSSNINPESQAQSGKRRLGYTNVTLHERLNRDNEKSGICSVCKAETNNTEFALIHGREYSLNIDDYKELCSYCHRNYDYHISEIYCSCSQELRQKKYIHGTGYLNVDRDDYVLKICVYSKCGQEFYTTLSRKIYCSPTCKLYAYRERKGIVTKQSPQHSMCQREGCNNSIPEGSRSNRLYCSNACVQKVYHAKNAEKEKRQRAVKALKLKSKKLDKMITEDIEKGGLDFVEGLMK